MRLGEYAEALELTVTFMGMKSTIHPVVLWEGREGITLVDANFFREAHPAHGHAPEHKEHRPAEPAPHPFHREGESHAAHPPAAREEYFGE